MSDIESLEGRITAALDRISAGAERLAALEPAPVAADGAPSEDLAAQVAQLTARLDEERTANAQLEERVKLLKERQDGKLAELEANVEAGRGRSAR
ncbi:MAG: hypothetical protein AAGL89_17105, partial [Pseudomonadota bacterium]